jgi:hypothetical protein
LKNSWKWGECTRSAVIECTCRDALVRLEDAFQERESDLRRDVTCLQVIGIRMVIMSNTGQLCTDCVFFRNQDENICLIRKLKLAEDESLAFKERLSRSLLSNSVEAPGASECDSNSSLKLVIDVQHRQIEHLQTKLTSMLQSTACTNMNCIDLASRARAAIYVASAVPLSHRQVLHAGAAFSCDLIAQVPS